MINRETKTSMLNPQEMKLKALSSMRKIQTTMQRLCLPAFLTLSFATHAQTSDEEDEPTVYQVEILIFERLSNEYGDDHEKWLKNIKLDYPSRTQHLITEPPSTDEQVEIEPAQQETASTPNPPDGDLGKTSEQLENEAETVHYFHPLPEEQKTLAQKASALQRKGMRVLFHEAWQQPISNLEEASAITVFGGEKYDEHFELEGSVTLSVSRYLHAHTDLWLTVFEANYGQEPYFWPPLPSRPIPEIAEDISAERQALLENETTEPLLQTESAAVSETLTSTILNQANNSTIENEFASSDIEQTRDSDSNIELNPDTNKMSFNNFGDSAFQNTSKDTENEGLETRFSLHSNNNERLDEPATHLIKEVITLKRSRKMRSKELHYIDHPRLGVLIRIDPLELDKES